MKKVFVYGVNTRAFLRTRFGRVSLLRTNFFVVIVAGSMALYFPGPEVMALEIEGFIDYRYDDAKDAESSFGFRLGNGVEIGMSEKLTKMWSVQATLVTGGDGVSLGPSFFDYNFFSNLHHKAHGSMIDHSGIKVGLFDVPFGIESRYYSSVDRPSISAPFLTSRLLNGGWTDVGFHLYLGNECGEQSCPGPFTIDIFGVNGLLWDNGADAIFGTSDDVGLGVPLTASTSGKTFGTRLGYTLNDSLELGASFARGDYRLKTMSSRPEMTLAGADISFARGPLTLRGEYAAFEGDNPGAADITSRTWYVEATFKLGDRWLPYARYDAIKFGNDRDGDGAANDNVTAWTGGMKWTINEDLALRAEYQRFSYQNPASVSAAHDDAYRASLVAKF